MSALVYALEEGSCPGHKSLQGSQELAQNGDDEGFVGFRD